MARKLAESSAQSWRVRRWLCRHQSAGVLKIGRHQRGQARWLEVGESSFKAARGSVAVGMRWGPRWRASRLERGRSVGTNEKRDGSEVGRVVGSKGACVGGVGTSRLERWKIAGTNVGRRDAEVGRVVGSKVGVVGGRVGAGTDLSRQALGVESEQALDLSWSRHGTAVGDGIGDRLAGTGS